MYSTHFSVKCIALMLVLVLLVDRNLDAQIGAHSHLIQWQQIKVNNHLLVFPKHFEKQAFRAGSILEYMDTYGNESIGDKTYPLQILLHNQTVIPNGFVGVAPYRSEFFATPPLSPTVRGAVDWLDRLTIHEYRHAQQYANSRVGLTKLAHILLGNNGWGLANSLSPNWFWEGDAVWMETALTPQGRGRAPIFTRIQRSLLLEDIQYSYEKARNRSFKDLVPNHYPLGYIMTTYARQRFGKEVWKKIFKDASSYRFPLYTFSHSTKKQTGLSTPQLYKEAYLAYQKKWEKEAANTTLSNHQRITPNRQNPVTNYHFPYYLTDGSLVYLKDSFQKTMGLYLSNNGEEKRITSVGFRTMDYLSVTKDKAIWTEFEVNPRRFNQNYSNIVYYDFNTHEKIRLTKRSRLFTPSFSNNGQSIVAVEITPDQLNRLVLLESNSGKVMQYLENEENYFLTFPKWLEDDNGLVFIYRKNNQLALFTYDLANQSYQQISNWTHHSISDLYVKNDRVYFTASFSGIDNIYSISLIAPYSPTVPSFSSTLTQHSSVRVGAYHPSMHPSTDTLTFSEYHHEGAYLSKMKLSAKANKEFAPLSFVEPTEQTQYLVNQVSEEGGNILDKLTSKEYPISPYKGLLKGLQLHSWSLTPDIATPSLLLEWDNLLADVGINVLGGYNINEKSPFYNASLVYSKLYPQIRLSVGSAKRNTVFETTADTLGRQQFDQHTLGSTVSIPLSWRKGDFSTRLWPYINYSHRLIRNPVIEELEVDNFYINTMDIGVTFNHLRRRALQQVDTRFGYWLFMSYAQTLDSNRNHLLRINNSFYLPGIGQNHSIRLQANYRNQTLSDAYQFSDGFSYPRGYSKRSNDNFLKLAVNYHLPIAYPDWGFKGITYFRRIRANFFFDYGKATSQHLKQNEFKSAGVEIILDNNFFMELPVSIGWRNSFLLNKDIDQRYEYEFFVRSDFF